MILHTGSEYYLAWLIYLAAVLSAHLLLWRALKVISSRDIKTVLHLSLAAILLTPTTLTTGQNYWVPAFMSALMDGLNDGPAAAMSDLWSILIVMLLLVSISLGLKLYRRRKQSASAG